MLIAMNGFIMDPAPRIVFGAGEARRLTDHLKSLGTKKAMIVYDRGVFAGGVVTPILDALGDLEYRTYDGIEPESPDSVVESLRDFANDFGADTFVAIGGGSTTDTTRAAMLLSGTTDPVDGYFDHPLEQPPKGIRYVCIPTTAGTGAEMSPGGPIYRSKTCTKQALRLPPKITDLVILDAELTVGLPPFVTYTTAMDALAHSLEAMTGRRRNPMTDMICGQAVEYILKNLPAVMENPKDLDARGALLLASNLAIGCQNIRHLGHAVCQPVGARLHLAHGYTCALVLPSVVARYSDLSDLQPVWQRIALRTGIGAGDPMPGRVLAEHLRQMNRQYGIPTLQEKGADWAEILACAEEILSDGRLLPNCPRDVTREDVEFALRGMYAG